MVDFKSSSMKKGNARRNREKDAKGIIGTMYQNGLPDDIRVYSILNGNVNDLNRRNSSVLR
ncbi:hypothetical protein BCBMB205_18130 [Bacillus sp. CN2]|nr:hypothetical protein BCBMB205_18130 [Bacillus velezensis]ARZ58149.1 hypothetical protein BAGQ_1915 [Bacillus velezensis]GFR53394.1 hypothetical protein BCBMB205_18130 [Bacillus sp. CN2]